MGSWSVYCGISNISIVDGNECVFLPIKKNTTYQGYLPYLPATLPIFGKYNDYGGIESIKEDDNTKLIEEHFNCKIQDFCDYFTGSENPSEDDWKYDNYEEIKKWKYMFIDRKVYDFMSKHNKEEYGNFDYGNPELLKFLGGEYIGLDKSVDRYNQLWRINNVDFHSDKTWLKRGTHSIYNYDPSLLLKVLPDDKKLLLKKHRLSLWRIYDMDYIARHMFWIVGVDGGHYHLDQLLNDIEDKYDDETYEKLFPGKKRKDKKVLALKDKYVDNIKMYGDYFVDLIIIRENMYCFSQMFKPYVHYITPQCGEFKDHQKILEKFSEINKSKINNEDEED